jgi:beta-mannanase
MTVGEPPTAPQYMAERESWLNHPLNLMVASASWVNWEPPYDLGWQLGVWKAYSANYTLFYTPLMLGPGGTLSQCAAGSYDSIWTDFANALNKYGFTSPIVRLGHEMTGNWFSWSALGQEADFVSCYRNVVNAMRQAQPTANLVRLESNPRHICGRAGQYLSRGQLRDHHKHRCL